MNRRFTKIKYDGQKVHLEWEVVYGDDSTDEYVLKCTDRPAQRFVDALQSLALHVAICCEVDNAEAWSSAITVKGVSLSHTNGIMGAVITATRALKNSNSPLVINTPHKPAEPYAEGEGGDAQLHTCLPTACITAINALISESDRYINGHRQQMQLFGGDNGSSDIGETVADTGDDDAANHKKVTSAA